MKDTSLSGSSFFENTILSDDFFDGFFMVCGSTPRNSLSFCGAGLSWCNSNLLDHIRAVHVMRKSLTPVYILCRVHSWVHGRLLCRVYCQVHWYIESSLDLLVILSGSIISDNCAAYNARSPCSIYHLRSDFSPLSTL